MKRHGRQQPENKTDFKQRAKWKKQNPHHKGLAPMHGNFHFYTHFYTQRCTPAQKNMSGAWSVIKQLSWRKFIQEYIEDGSKGWATERILVASTSIREISNKQGKQDLAWDMWYIAEVLVIGKSSSKRQHWGIDHSSTGTKQKNNLPSTSDRNQDLDL